MTKPEMLIIKSGSSIAEACERFGDFERWFMDSLGPDRFECTTVDVYSGGRLPADPAGHGFDGIVITGSPAMVSQRNEWSEATADWLVQAHHAVTPILGVCFGQLRLIAGAYFRPVCRS